MIRTLLATTAVVALLALGGCEGQSTAGAGAEQGKSDTDKAPKPAPGSGVGDEVGESK